MEVRRATLIVLCICVLFAGCNRRGGPRRLSLPNPAAMKALDAKILACGHEQMRLSAIANRGHANDVAAKASCHSIAINNGEDPHVRCLKIGHDAEMVKPLIATTHARCLDLAKQRSALAGKP